MSKDKIIAVVGTTASGKTTLAVDLCFRYNGEVVSADSRQVFKYMDIGSGKDLDEYSIKINNTLHKIPYHMIDVVEPSEEFDLYKWVKGAKLAIKDILERAKVPVVAGGTGLYTQALIDGYELDSENIDKKERERLEKLSIDDLYSKLNEIDLEYAQSLNNSERNNKRRIVRAIELRLKDKDKTKKQTKPYNALILGLTSEREELKKRIKHRLEHRFDKEEMLEEVISLHKDHGVSYERLESFGLEYKLIAQYLQGKLQKEEMQEKLYVAICQFSKRQMTWLRRWEKQEANIVWLHDYAQAYQEVEKFLNN